MMKFKCSRCGGELTSFDILRTYNKEEDSCRCPTCKMQAKLRHFTKDVKIGEIIKDRNKIFIYLTVASIPLQVFIYLHLLNLIWG
jgi:DNA-directed RNA polymerase subunit RPC12/RpoP